MNELMNHNNKYTEYTKIPASNITQDSKAMKAHESLFKRMYNQWRKGKTVSDLQAFLNDLYVFHFNPESLQMTYDAYANSTKFPVEFPVFVTK